MTDRMRLLLVIVGLVSAQLLMSLRPAGDVNGEVALVPDGMLWLGGMALASGLSACGNPLDLRACGEQVHLSELADIIRGINFEQDFAEPPEIGYEDFAYAIAGFDSVIEKTNAQFKINAWDRDGYPMRDFRELAERIRELGNEEKLQKLDAVLYGTVVDTYTLADSKRFTQLLKNAGYDGVILYDVFDAGLRNYEGNIDDLRAGHSCKRVISTYRPFDHNQIKSACGNSGAFARDCLDLTDPLPAPVSTLDLQIDGRRSASLVEIFIKPKEKLMIP